MQTREISRSCNNPTELPTVVINGETYIDGDAASKMEYHPGYHETNSILGRCPSIHKVNAYFIITGLAHYFIAKTLPYGYRDAFQYVTIGMEYKQDKVNYELGIRMPF